MRNVSKIEWNKVTWYSKAVALALFVLLPFGGFWLGAQYGAAMQLVQEAQAPTSAITTESGANAYYENVAEWQTDARPDGGFSVAHPIDFSTDDVYAISPVTDWRFGANNNPGIKRLTLTIPAVFEPQTNFVEARLTVGDSGNDLAVKNCMQPDETGGPGSGFATTTINGVPFSIFKSADAGAGNYYETMSYRTLRTGRCYAVEYTLHSSQIANFPSSYNLKLFDVNKVSSVLDRIVGTFKFL